MAIETLVFEAEVKAPIEKVFTQFADHQWFTGLFGSTCRRVKDGEGDINGLGSTRRFLSGPFAFEETIVHYQPFSELHYAISKGSPVKNHIGKIRFTQNGDVTRIDYTIALEGKLPGIAPIVLWAIKGGWQRYSPAKLAALEAL